VETIEALATNPRPPGCRKLAGYKDVLRIRVGTYRVLYSVNDKRIIVIVLKIGHRRDVYR
jgi:mRNA interferase RelE/StbE